MSKIQLKPINHLSESEANLLYEQRVQCGWNIDLVDLWRQQIRDGDRLMWWIFFEGNDDPIGHIGLALVDYKNDLTLADKATGRASINTFFILPQHQGSGAGRNAMDAVEAEAAKEKYGIKVLTLDTDHPKHLKEETWKALAGPDWEKKVPKISLVDWYQRRGYKPYKEELRYKVKSYDGKQDLEFYGLFMEKQIA